jgi:hypothetical protein
MVVVVVVEVVVVVVVVGVVVVCVGGWWWWDVGSFHLFDSLIKRGTPFFAADARRTQL